MQERKPINLRLALFIAVSLCLGIISAYSFKAKEQIWGFIFVAIFLLTIIAFFILFYCKEKMFIRTIFAFVFIVFFFIGFLTFSVQFNNYINADLDNHHFEVSGKIIEANETDTGMSFMLDKVSVKGVKNGKLDYKVNVYVLGDADLDIGDIVKFNATLKDKNLFYENTFSPYDLANDVKYTANVYAEQVLVVGKRLSVFETCNVFIRDTLKRGLDYREFSVAYAMLTGNSELMDENVITAYRYLGVAHIFAVSGLHIGFLATALNFLFNKLRMKRLIKAFLITALLIFYLGICGFTASSIRATVMSAVMLFLSVKGERYDGLSAVFIAGIFILLLNPVQLFCVGFQFSFTVVIGILLLAKPIEKVVTKGLKFLPKKVCSAIGVVLSAQLSGIPISLANFGYFSPIAIISNFILIPVVGVIFYFLILLTIFGGTFSIPQITLFLPNYVLKGLNIVLTALDSKALLVSGITFGVFTVFYYTACIVPSGLINMKFRTKITATIVSIAVFISGTVALNVANNKYANVYVCGSDTASVTVIGLENENTMIISDIEKIYSLGNLRRLSYKSGIIELDSIIISGGFKYDMQVLVSRLRQVFDINEVYYYGEKDAQLELIMLHSFKDLKVTAFKEYELLPTKGFVSNFTEDGCAVNLIVNGKRIVVASQPDEYCGYDGIDEGADILIAGQSVEQLHYRLKPKRVISYRTSNIYYDGESNGNYFLSFK